MTITEALLDIIRGTPTTDGFTVAELCALAKVPATFCHRQKIRDFLRAEIAAGRIAPAHGRRQAIDGNMRQVPVYIPKSS